MNREIFSKYHPKPNSGFCTICDFLNISMTVIVSTLSKLICNKCHCSIVVKLFVSVQEIRGSHHLHQATALKTRIRTVLIMAFVHKGKIVKYYSYTNSTYKKRH